MNKRGVNINRNKFIKSMRPTKDKPKTFNPHKVMQDINPNLEIANYGPWSYLKFKNEKAEESELKKTYIDSMSKFVAASYMKRTHVLDISGYDVDTDMSSDEMVAIVVRETRRILQYTDADHFAFKAVDKFSSMYCAIHNAKLMVSEDKVEDVIEIKFVVHDNSSMDSSAYIFYIDLHSSTIKTPVGPMMLSHNKKHLESMLAMFLIDGATKDGHILSSLGDLLLLATVLRAARKKLKESEFMNGSEPSHGPEEMYAIVTVYKYLVDEKTICIPSVVEYPFKQTIHNDEILDRMQKEFISSSLHTDKNPLVDLSEKEFKYIMNYPKRHQYMMPEDYEGIRISVDMTKKVIQSRYGSSFIYPIVIRGERVESQLLFTINDDSGTILMSIPDGDIGFMLAVVFDNMREFDLYSNLVTISLSVMVYNPQAAPASSEELDKRIPPELDSIEELFTLIYRICAMFIVIADRPERTRVIKEVRVPREFSQGTPSDEKDYVIRRILKTRSDAKEHVKRMSGLYKDREYTMETWSRAGHTRQLKDGRIIYIGECTCHRQLPLSNKEIHLKL